MKTKELKNILRDLDSFDFGELFDVASDLISEVAKQNADITALQAENARLREENDRLRAALEAVEFIQGGIGDPNWDFCPWCISYRGKHRADCQRQAALGIA